MITGARGMDLPPPLFLTFCLQIYFQEHFFISLLFHLFFLILTCSCQYSYNLMLTSNCRCRPYIDNNNPQDKKMQFDVNIRLYEYWHEQVEIRKKRWNNKEIKNFFENKFVNRKLEKRGVRATSACGNDSNANKFLPIILLLYGHLKLQTLGHMYWFSFFL
jgi:hypothetical protein